MTDATPITAEQIAELKEALANATKGEWKTDLIDAVGETFHMLRRGEREPIEVSEADNGERDIAFIVLAHNLLHSLIAAAEEAERLRGDVERLRATEKVAIVGGFFTQETLRRERDAAFAAGRKAGVEDAAEEVSHSLCDVAENEDLFMQHRDYFTSAILALIDAPSEEPAGEGAAAEIERLTKERDDALSENRLIAHYKKHRDEAIAAYQSVRAKLDRAERVKRENADMRKALAAFDMVTHAHKVEITEKASGANVVLTDGEISGLMAALAGLDAPAAPEPSALAEARETIAEAVKIIKPMARAYDGAINEIVLTWIQESPDESRIVEHRSATIPIGAARAFVDKHGGTDEAAKGEGK